MQDRKPGLVVLEPKILVWHQEVLLQSGDGGAYELVIGYQLQAS